MGLKCCVCAGTKYNSSTSYRCEEHDLCSMCGTKRIDLDDVPLGTKDGFICQPCENKRIEDVIKEFQKEEHYYMDFYSDSVIICPHCGYEHETDYSDICDGNEEYYCSNCRSKFIVEAEISVTYQTKKMGK